jgi:hypothetical protein
LWPAKDLVTLSCKSFGSGLEEELSQLKKELESWFALEIEWFKRRSSKFLNRFLTHNSPTTATDFGLVEINKGCIGG